MIEDNAISVVIPVYNGGRFIAAAVRSVLEQTFKELEVIVVNDGSTDDTEQVVGNFDDSRLRQIVQPNLGLAAARNRGIQEAIHPVIAFLDADDEWLPTRLERQVSLLAPKRFLSSDVLFWDEASGETLGRYDIFDRFPRDRNKFSGDVLVPLLAQNFIHPSSVLIFKHDILHHGGFDESLPVVEDWDMWLRLAEDMMHQRVDQPLVRIRRRADSLQSDPQVMTQSATRVLDSAARRLRASGRLDDAARTSLGLGYFGVRAVRQSRAELLAAALRRPWRWSRWKWAGASLIRPHIRRRR